MLILGGTAWLGREIATQALALGHDVTCLARGESGVVAAGAAMVVADRDSASAYAEVAAHDWDEVVDLSWQPAQVRAALTALAAKAGHWTFVSSASVYAENTVAGADESTPLLPTLMGDFATGETYGEGKVACEEASRTAVGDRLLIARVGLIGGPEDPSSRGSGWVLRAARSSEPILVPDALDAPTQIVDVRDLAAWLLASAETGTTGVYDVVGPIITLGEWIALSCAVAQHSGTLVTATAEALRSAGVGFWSGADSMTLWIPEPDHSGFMARSGAAAAAAGLRHRPRRDLLADSLAWERTKGLDPPRPAGLTPAHEARVKAALALG